MENNEAPILFFDGVCNLCNGLINWLIDRLPSDKIKFSSLQGVTSKKLLPLSAYQDLDTVVLWKKNKVINRSAAIIHVLSLIGGPWILINIFLIIPAPLRDFIYKVVAKNRYRLFGKKDVCRLPTEKDRAYFLE